MNFKKFLVSAFVAVMVFAATTAQAQSLSPSTKWHWDKGIKSIDFTLDIDGLPSGI